MAANQPPTDDAEQEWVRLERERQIRQDYMNRRKEEQETLDSGAATSARTTAQPRPNAYITEEMGIPRPYGGSAPFRPAEPGAQMRHFRPPSARAIVI